MKKSLFKIKILTLLFVGSVIAPHLVSAQLQPSPTATATASPTTQFDWDGKISITNNTGKNDIADVIGKLILWLLGIIALVATIMIVYAGVMFVFNAGNEKRVTQAKNTLIWAIIGLVVSIGAFALVNIVFGVLG